MNIILKGTVKRITQKKQISDNLEKQELIIGIDEETPYPQEIILQALNKYVQLLNGLKEGDAVTIQCNLKGKSNGDKHYNQLNIWSIDKM